MFGIGVSELILLVVIALVLFGTPVLTFVLGYTLGRKSSVTSDSSEATKAPDEEPKELAE